MDFEKVTALGLADMAFLRVELESLRWGSGEKGKVPAADMPLMMTPVEVAER